MKEVVRSAPIRLHFFVQFCNIAHMGAIHAAILCDVMSSRHQSNFRAVRDRTLEELSERHMDEGWIKAPYAVTAWDEFQVLIHEVRGVPKVFWSLVTGFYPLHLRIGVGIGSVEIDLDNDAPLNEAATGEAFFRARKALNSVKKGKDQKYHPSSQAHTGDRSIDLFMNTTFHLLDALIARVTPLQWEVILEYEKHGQQDRVAEMLGKADSTVSRSLKRSYYWQMADAIESMAEYLGLLFPAQLDAKSGDCT
jgi:hypothetical protein